MYFAIFKSVISFLLVIEFSYFLYASEDTDDFSNPDSTHGKVPIHITSHKKAIQTYEKEFQDLFNGYCVSRCLAEFDTKEFLQALVDSFLKDYSLEELLELPNTINEPNIRYAERLSSFTSLFHLIVNKK